MTAPPFSASSSVLSSSVVPGRSSADYFSSPFSSPTSLRFPTISSSGSNNNSSSGGSPAVNGASSTRVGSVSVKIGVVGAALLVGTLLV
ncbi:hypothetical protein M422DRAFT_27680 [Sphaerobolus stellatus SS14]|nr:hypothetical protein M422DRAFT_27680 [Sphaerobolus stellatus SS14]